MKKLEELECIIKDIQTKINLEELDGVVTKEYRQKVESTHALIELIKVKQYLVDIGNCNDIIRTFESLKTIRKDLRYAEKLKENSVAIVDQITTISKMRIYDPKNKNDSIAGIKIPSEYMDKIDEKIKELFTKC